MFNSGWYSLPNVPQWTVFPLLVWSLVWKGLALWRAAKQNQRNWFVALLVINTVGILEIIYLYVFAPKKAKEGKQTKETEAK